MSRVLITGMTASQMSLNANERSLSFAGVMAKALKSTKHEVTILEPDVLWTEENLDYYDHVVVGIAPITSISANHAYGALHVLRMLWNSDKMTLFVDAPNPSQISASLNAIVSQPKNIVKPFYSGRVGYQRLLNVPGAADEILSAVSLLVNEQWPDTVYPSLPWKTDELVAAEFPKGASNTLFGINLDSFLISETPPGSYERVNRWAADDQTSTWTKKLSLTLDYPVEKMKLNKGWTDKQIEELISHSTGSLITPHKKTTWWTHRYVQSMNTGTPVATEWKESGLIGDSWSVLAASIESMSPSQRQELSWNQTAQYMVRIPSKDTALKILENLIGVNSNVENGQR